MKKTNHVIGILGGMGPQAGVNLAEHLVASTRAECDQEHIPLVLFSFPETVPDRTTFLLGQADTNPAFAIAEQLEKMAALGVTTAVMACNTAHAAPIMDVILRLLKERRTDLHLLDLVAETVNHVRDRHPQVNRVGILATHGTYQTGLYDQALSDAGLEAVLPDLDVREDCVQAAIYSPGFGIKAGAGEVTTEARHRIQSAIVHLHERGAQAIVLGCTEVSLAVDESQVEAIPIIDPARIIASRLIQMTYPDKLKPDCNTAQPSIKM